MNAKEFLDAGRLSAAIEQLNQDVKSQPTDARLRSFLFELLCFAGNYDRAERQLDVIAHQSATAEAGAQFYRNVLAAEKARLALFREGVQPRFLFEPPAYTALHLEAVDRLRENRPADAARVLEASEEARAACPGQMDGGAFGDFRDEDDLLAPFLEAIVQDRYVWLPFEQISRLSISPPKRLRDLIWIPATVECRVGPVGEVLIPVLYTGSSEHPDEHVRLGRMTEWKSVEKLALGAGQRVFLVDDDERALLDIREVEFGSDAAAAEGS
jgi:type VI secretion system protein ImpE